MTAEFDLALPRVKLFEGFRPDLYMDSIGVPTIGYGCALEGWPEPFAAAVAKLQLMSAETEAKTLPGYDGCSPLRRSVLIEMVFNLGLTHVKSFTKFLTFLQSQNWKAAAAEMLDSKWATQVGNRAKRLAHIMETDTDQ